MFQSIIYSDSQQFSSLDTVENCENTIAFIFLPIQQQEEHLKNYLKKPGRRSLCYFQQPWQRVV